MSNAILKTHLDGAHIVLGEPSVLLANAPLLEAVCVPDAERSEWAALGAQTLARAYGDDEPNYSTADIKPQ